jgi:hypothetical protein
MSGSAATGERDPIERLRARFASARRVADAVLYEGYVLYPYRASSRKNRWRWTFGVVAPRAWREAGGCEPSAVALECLIDHPGEARVEGLLRFLQVERRTVEARDADGGFRRVEELEAAGRRVIAWDEAAPRELGFAFPLDDGRVARLAAPGARSEETLVDAQGTVAGRLVRQQAPLSIALAAARAPAGEGLSRLRIAVENLTPCPDPAAAREEAVAWSLVGAHLLLAVSGGSFVSLIDPPERARDAARGCASDRLFPILVGMPGRHDQLLGSPIALADHPQIAPESPGESYDATEIDELIALSTLSLTDEEKREARATSARSSALIERVERLSPEALLKLHGARRPPRQTAPAQGSRVRIRIRPAAGARRSDAQDLFLDGRVAVVEQVLEDLEGRTCLALLLEDDPASELHRWHGRRYHFYPDEVELLEGAP